MGIGKFQPSTKSISLNRSTKEIDTIDYIREGTSYTRFGRNPFTGGFWANGWNITKIIFIYLFIHTFFSLISLQVRPVDGFLRTTAQKTWNHARMCLLGVMKLKFNFKPLFIPQNCQRDFFSTENALTMEALESKLPLIIIVAHKSCIVNRQIRVGDSQYGTFDHVFWPPVPIIPKSPNFALQIAVFFLKTHCSRHHSCTLC